METLTRIVSNAKTIYMPKGREAQACTVLLAELGIVPPTLNGDIKQAYDDQGRKYVRVRGPDGVELVRKNVAKKAIALAGTDAMREKLGSKNSQGITYAAFGVDQPMCTFELLLPKKPDAQALISRLQGTGEPLRIVTGSPTWLAGIALEKGLNMAPVDMIPGGEVELITAQLIENGLADAAADLVETGSSADKAGFLCSRTENLASYVGTFDPRLDTVYPAVVWQFAEFA